MDPNPMTTGMGLKTFGEAQELLQRDQGRERAESISWKRGYLSWVLQEERV